MKEDDHMFINLVCIAMGYVNSLENMEAGPQVLLMKLNSFVLLVFFSKVEYFGNWHPPPNQNMLPSEENNKRIC